MAHQPDPNQAPNIVDGLRAIRKMHIRIIRETGLTSADEMLYPGNWLAKNRLTLSFSLQSYENF